MAGTPAIAHVPILWPLWSQAASPPPPPPCVREEDKAGTGWSATLQDSLPPHPRMHLEDTGKMLPSASAVPWTSSSLSDNNFLN